MITEKGYSYTNGQRLLIIHPLTSFNNTEKFRVAWSTAIKRFVNGSARTYKYQEFDTIDAAQSHIHERVSVTA